jgi:sortase (surface protein transpeptidase)
LLDATRRHRRGPLRFAAVLLVVVGLVASGCVGPFDRRSPLVSVDPSADFATPEGEPVIVRIPSIAVRVDLVELGLESDGAMEVPDFGLAGWYTEGPRPGHPGPSVIAAHVDSRTGPDVFHDLDQLDPGDEVEVVYDSGDRARFAVLDSEQVPKDALPGDRIWPETQAPVLSLITCGGDWVASQHTYDSNVVVYTERVA